MSVHWLGGRWAGEWQQCKRSYQLPPPFVFRPRYAGIWSSPPSNHIHRMHARPPAPPAPPHTQKKEARPAPNRWRDSAVARASDDYYPTDRASHRPHILACAFNSLFLSPLALPDWVSALAGRPAAVHLGCSLGVCSAVWAPRRLLAAVQHRNAAAALDGRAGQPSCIAFNCCLRREGDFPWELSEGRLATLRMLSTLCRTCSTPSTRRPSCTRPPGVCVAGSGLMPHNMDCSQGLFAPAQHTSWAALIAAGSMLAASTCSR